jgi:ribosomal protein S3AE
MKALYTPFLYLFVVIHADVITAFAPPMTQCTVKWMVPTPKQQQQQLEKNCRKVSYQQVSTQRSLLSFQNVIATVLHHNPDDHHVAMAGTIWPIIHKLLTAPTKFRSI